MPIKSFKPITPTRRYQTVVTRDDLTKGKKAEKLLTTGKQRSGGRTSSGRISTRFRGGGHKRTLSEVDFKRDKQGVPARVAALEYDPNRSARLALLNYADGEKRYILAPVGLAVGQNVVSGPEADIFVGQRTAAEEHPAWYVHSQRRTAARQGRPDGALGRWPGTAGFQRGRLRAGEASFERSTPRTYRLHGDDWPGR